MFRISRNISVKNCCNFYTKTLKFYAITSVTEQLHKVTKGFSSSNVSLCWASLSSSNMHYSFPKECVWQLIDKNKLNQLQYLGKAAPLKVEEIVPINEVDNKENKEELENIRHDFYYHDDDF